MKRIIVFVVLLTFLIIILACTSQAPEKEEALKAEKKKSEGPKAEAPADTKVQAAEPEKTSEKK